MGKNEDGRDDEISALMGIEDIDTAKIAEQINKRQGIEAGVEPIKEEPIKEEPPKTEPQKTEPPKAEVPVVEPVKKDVPDPEAIVNGRLKEIFGDQFTSVDELKKANIPSQLQELESLRQKTQTLETQLAKKPKHNFASDDIAKFNEFTRDTGIASFDVFKKINTTDIANMDDMDALIWQRVSEDPDLAADVPRVRKSFERKFNVEKSKVEAGDLTQEEYDDNLFELRTEARKAKNQLLELKGKIRMPDIPADEPPEGRTKWTPEIEKSQKAAWGTVNEKMVAEFSKIPITLKGGKEPIVNFVLPEETKSKIMTNAIDYVVSNQMEVSVENVESVAREMYSDLRLSCFDDILHAVFERARSMTEEEYLRTYHNPSSRNEDTPPSAGDPESDEAKREKAFQAELER